MKKAIIILLLICGFITMGCTNQSSTSQSAPTMGSKSLESMTLSDLRNYESQGLLPSNVEPFIAKDGTCVKISNKKITKCTSEQEQDAFVISMVGRP